MKQVKIQSKKKIWSTQENQKMLAINSFIVYSIVTGWFLDSCYLLCFFILLIAWRCRNPRGPFSSIKSDTINPAHFDFVLTIAGLCPLQHTFIIVGMENAFVMEYDVYRSSLRRRWLRRQLRCSNLLLTHDFHNLWQTLQWTNENIKELMRTMQTLQWNS